MVNAWLDKNPVSREPSKIAPPPPEKFKRGWGGKPKKEEEPTPTIVEDEQQPKSKRGRPKKSEEKYKIRSWVASSDGLEPHQEMMEGQIHHNPIASPVITIWDSLHPLPTPPERIGYSCGHGP